MSAPRRPGRPSKSGRRAPGEDSVYFDKSKQRYFASVSEGSGKNRVRHKVSGLTRKEAVARLAELKAKMAESDLNFVTVKVAQLATAWWQSTHGDMAESTQSTQWIRVEAHIVNDDRIGRIKVADLRTEHVERWLAAKASAGYETKGKRRDYSHRYLEMMRSDLSAMIRWAIRRHWLRWNPVTEARLPVTAPRSELKRTLTRQQAINLIEAAQLTDRTCANFVIVTLSTGARPSETAALQWDDVDFEANTIRFERAIKRTSGGRPIGVGPIKNEVPRTLGVDRAVLDAIRHEKVRQAKMRLAAGPAWSPAWDGYIFLTALGTPHWSSNLRKAVRAIAFEAGINIALDLDPYELRHTWASVQDEMGVAVNQIVDQLGHKDDRMFWKHYRHRPDPIIRNPGITEGPADE